MKRVAKTLRFDIILTAMKRRKIGIFGGTFDPFTLAHREIVKQALKQKIVDFVYICPTIVTWHRQNYTPWLSDDDKVKVISEMLDGDDFSKAAIWTEDLHLRQLCAGNSFLTSKYVDEHRFIDTLLAIKTGEDDPDAEFYAIIGPDEYANFTSWYAWDSIIKQIKSLVVVVDEDSCGRDGKPVALDDPKTPAIPLKLKSDFLKTSAASLREKFTATSPLVYIAAAKKSINAGDGDRCLLHTPIFDIVRGKMTKTGLEPVLVKAPDWVSLMVEKDGKLLVEKQFRYGADDFVEEFPCGMVERGEDPLDATVRELEEETGVKLLDKTEIVKLGQTNPNPAFMMNTMHYYYVNLDTAKHVNVVRQLDPHEDIELEWRDKDQFIFELANAASSGEKQVPAIALALVNLYKHSQKKTQQPTIETN